MGGVTHAQADEVLTAGLYGFVHGKDGEGVGTPVLVVGVVAAEPVGSGYVWDVDLDAVVGRDEEGSGPLLGFVKDLYRLTERAALDDLLTEG